MNRLLTTLIILAVLIAVFAVISIAFDPSLHILRYTGYILFALIGVISIRMGSIEMRKATHVVWYKQPLIRAGLVFLVVAILSFCIFDFYHILVR